MSYDKKLSILDIDNTQKEDTSLTDEYMKNIGKMTFEDAISTVLTDHHEIGKVISEITRVETEIVAFQAGDLDTIELDEELTTEMSIMDLAKLSYSKLNKDKDRILERAYEYIRALINRVITMIKTTFTKYMAVHSKHINISKEYLEVLDKLDLTEVDNTNDFDIFRQLGATFDKRNIMTLDTLYFINSDKIVEDVISRVKDYGNYISIVRPIDKVIMNTVSTEIGSARADIMREWNDKADKKFIELFVNNPINQMLNYNSKYASLVSDVEIDVKDVSKFTPITTDGSIITCIYKTDDHQLRLMRLQINGLPRETTINMSNLKEIMVSISKTDLGRLVKEDIKLLEKIEKDAKIYFKQIKDEIGSDRGKRNASFNNTVTMVNSALAIANNRMKLTNNIIAVTEELVKRIGE